MPDRDYYAELGVPRNATDDDLGRAFRKLAAKYHPDRNPGDKAAEEKFRRIAEAYNVLHDPKARAAFDRGGEEQVRVDTGFHGFDSTEDILSHFGDLFGGLFDGRVRRRVFRDAAPDYVVRQEPANTEMEVTIDVALAALGGTIDIPLPRGRTAEMKLPPGTQAGQIFRLGGQGIDGGDLLVRVDVEIPRSLTREQRRLMEELRRSLSK